MMKKAINTIYDNKEKLIFIGLTGQIGSGCSTAAKFMTKTKEDHNLPTKVITPHSSDRDRKRYIIYNHYINTWKPFELISASDIITSFLLQATIEDVKQLLTKLDLSIDDKIEEKFNEFNTKYKDINLSYSDEDLCKIGNEELIKIKTYLFQDLPKVSSEIKKYISSKYGYRSYSKIFQALGDNLRKYGQIKESTSQPNSDNVYIISQRIDFCIKVAEQYNKRELKPTHIVIDAFRNPIEMLYFREKYSSFYLITINASEDDINDRLYKKLKLNDEEIEEQRKKENPKKPYEEYDDFISQNIQNCIQNGDIHISNKGGVNNNNFLELYGQIIKYISLIKHPGLITPSLDEKMMQIANTAKLNSGCLSRQVGASVTNSNGSLIAMGWNSVADGQTPCLLRSKDELIQSTTSKSYSAYEKSNKFIKALKNYSPKIKHQDLQEKGLNQSFCFSEIHNLSMQSNNGNNDNCHCDKNQVHTRSLHAEENAFLQISKYGGQGVKGGTLYSTASPCELCSKKAYQLGIKRIVYIDPYPGIARKQILASGENTPKVELFKGAIGAKYYKLYEPILPFKDELKNLSS